MPDNCKTPESPLTLDTPPLPPILLVLLTITVVANPVPVELQAHVSK
jgi:hypothetical protein